MGRPRTVSDEEILQATLRVVAREGPRRFTLAQVGEEAGLSAPGLLQRFGTKRGLLLALSAASRREPREAIARAKGAHTSALDTLIDALSSAMAPLATPAALATSLEYLALDMTDAEFNAHARAFFAAFDEEVKALLRAARDKGELRDVDVDALARMIEVTFHGSTIAWGVRPVGALQDALRRDLAATLAPFRAARASGRY